MDRYLEMFTFNNHRLFDIIVCVFLSFIYFGEPLLEMKAWII